MIIMDDNDGHAEDEDYDASEHKFLFHQISDLP